MRTGIIGGDKTIVYPDDISFCFNPMIIRVYADSQVAFIVTDGAKKYIDVRSSYLGKVEIDISKYVQTMFNLKETESLLLSKEISVEVKTAEEQTFMFTTNVIWGVMNVGDVFNPPRKVVWFKKYPFTFSIYVASGIYLRKRFDSNKYQNFEVKNSGLVHIDPQDLFKEAVNFGVIRLDGNSFESSFEYTFDHTFRPIGNGVIIHRLEIDNSECGIYLRWIDRHGFYQYWLFQEGETVSNTEAGDSIPYAFSDEIYDYNGISRYDVKSMQMIKKACAPLVERDTFNMLLTLLSSPIVDMYLNGKWIPVNISPGTIVEIVQDLRDFEIEIELPKTISQRL